MKFSASSFVVASLSTTLVAKLVPARNDTLASDSKDLSARSRNVLARQSYDYCGATSYYCLNSNCCGITAFNCMPTGGECCADLSDYGFGLWCPYGSTCVVVSGYIQCQDESGDTFSADSSAVESAASTDAPPRATTTDADEPIATDESNTSTSGSHKTTKKSKVWIAGAVIGPLIGIAIIAGVVFFLLLLKKKKSRATATTGPVHFQGAASANQPMTSASQMGSAPVAPNPDIKTPAYTQQYEVPTPIASPPPQWTPVSPTPTTVSPAQATVAPTPGTISPAASSTLTDVSPVPFPPPQMTNELHGQSVLGPVSPMSTGSGAGYTSPVQQPQPVYLTAMEMSATQAPRHGAQELHG